MKIRGFVIARHPTLGFLLLHSSKKKNKTYQLPGGRAEPSDALQCKGKEMERANELQKLVALARVAAARELFEETGVDVRNDQNRLRWVGSASNFEDKKPPRKYFFELILQSHDSVTASTQKTPSTNCEDPTAFAVRLSDEHDAYRFVLSASEAAQLVQGHSKGACSSALRAYETHY